MEIALGETLQVRIPQKEGASQWIQVRDALDIGLLEDGFIENSPLTLAYFSEEPHHR